MGRADQRVGAQASFFDPSLLWLRNKLFGSRSPAKYNSVPPPVA